MLSTGLTCLNLLSSPMSSASSLKRPTRTVSLTRSRLGKGPHLSRSSRRYSTPIFRAASSRLLMQKCAIETDGRLRWRSRLYRMRHKKTPKKTKIPRKRQDIFGAFFVSWCQYYLRFWKFHSYFGWKQKIYSCLKWKVRFYNWTLVITSTAIPKMRIKLKSKKLEEYVYQVWVQCLRCTNVTHQSRLTSELKNYV